MSILTKYWISWLSRKTRADPERFVRGDPTLTGFFFFFFFFVCFLVDEGKKDQNTIISGPLLAHQGNAF